MSADIRLGFKEAARFFVETVDRIPAGKWDAPGLGIWSVRELVVHAAHTFRSVATYDGPARTAERIEVEDVPTVWVRMLDKAQDAERESRAQRTAADLGDDPPTTIRGWYEDALAVLDSAPDDHPVRSIGGGVRFIDWLDTRVVELTVHTMDIANAAGIEAQPPDAAMAATLASLSELAIATGKANDLVMAVTGRGRLPAGYSLMSG